MKAKLELQVEIQIALICLVLCIVLISASCLVNWLFGEWAVGVMLVFAVFGVAAGIAGLLLAIIWITNSCRIE